LEWYTYAAKAVEILVMAVVVYYTLELLRGSRGAGVFRGTLIIFAVCIVGGLFITQYAQLYRLHFLLNKVLAVFATLLIVVFQPELRRGLTRLGQQPLFVIQHRRATAMIREVVKAAANMSQNKIGALITFER
jgi:diadenylate cyclase